MTTKVYVRKSGEAVIPARVLKSFGIQPETELEIDFHVPEERMPTDFSVDIPPDKTVQDFLNEFEDKYQISSKDFYEKWQRGETDDDPELNEWAGFYQTKLELEKEGIDSAKATFKPFKKILFERE
ncbi:hypothetical protein H8E88_34240 [candidate division KSB1 bacterium]|nr:hypothetical protein [candidate division KSB1 bacterium]MBL7093854.1 hypothetical protein [candidate division KSB1 bacterium]